ncbi:MAG: hypothetical protein PUB21_04410 [Bacteroidales bacterium]|nr:hypothetical protein [Bacteroidales bacterium]
MKKTIVVAVSNPKRSIGKTIGVFDTCIRAMQKLNVLELFVGSKRNYFCCTLLPLSGKMFKGNNIGFWPISYANV